VSYATNLTKEGINSQYLIVFKPRRLVSSWTLVSGTEYSAAFSYGEITLLYFNSVLQTKASDATLVDGTWYFDVDLNVLNVNFGVDPATSDCVVVYELYFGTFDAHWYRDPVDSATRVVYYEPLITSSPTILSSSTDSLFGFLPSQSSSISISNATHILERHLYDSSFNNIDIDVYHYLDALTVDNMKFIFRGSCSAISYSDRAISFTIMDRNNIFDKEYRSNGDKSFYAKSMFPNLDPQREKRPIRTVYGVVDGFLPVNIGYKAEDPTTSDNRTWLCTATASQMGSVSSTVPASPSSTSTRTYLNTIAGFRVGDGIFIDNVGADDYALITAVNSTTVPYYVEHDPISNVAISTTTVNRYFISRIDINQRDIKYTALPGRDFTIYTDAVNNVSGFTFSSSLEANLSMAATLSPVDEVFCRVYGPKNDVTLGGSAY
jgi:hypothetical protein